MERMFSVINNRYKAFYGISNSFCWHATISHDILTSQSDALYQVCVQNMIDSGDSSFFLVKTRHLQRNWAANSLVGVFYESHSSPCPQEQMRSGLQRSGEFTFFSTPPDVFCIFQTCSLQHHPTLTPDFTQHPLEPQKALYNFFFFTCKQTLKCIIQLSTRLIPIPERLFFQMHVANAALLGFNCVSSISFNCKKKKKDKIKVQSLSDCAITKCPTGYQVLFMVK